MKGQVRQQGLEERKEPDETGKEERKMLRTNRCGLWSRLKEGIGCLGYCWAVGSSWRRTKARTILRWMGQSGGVVRNVVGNLCGGGERVVV